MFKYVLILFWIGISVNTALATDVFDIILDIDGVLIFDADRVALGRAAERGQESRYIEYNNETDHHYRKADGVEKLLIFLSELPGVKISYFSAGPRSRNIKVLESIILPNGSTALSLAEEGGQYRVFSRGDLDRSGGKRYKNLQKLPIDISLERVLIIDDRVITPKDQWRNILLVNSPIFNRSGLRGHDTHWNSLPVLLEPGERGYSEEVANIWHKELDRVIGLIKLALEKANHDISKLVDIVDRLQRTAGTDNPPKPYNELSLLYDKAQQPIGIAGRKTKKATRASSNKCTTLFLK